MAMFQPIKQDLLIKAVIDLSVKQGMLFRVKDMVFTPHDLKYELYLLTDCFTPLYCKADSPEECFTIMDEHLTYWKQHGVHPNV